MPQIIPITRKLGRLVQVVLVTKDMDQITPS